MDTSSGSVSGRSGTGSAFQNLKNKKIILILDTAMQADMWRMDRMVSMYMWKILLER